MTLTTPPLLYQQAVTNPIGVSPSTAPSLGYLFQNRTQVEAVGAITVQDPVDIYNFTYKAEADSGPVTLSLKNLNGDVSVRVQILNQNGTQILADSEGNADQQNAYAQAISSGLNLKSGNYLMKVTYGAGAVKNDTAQNYAVQLTSGSFTADYRTLGNSETYQQALLNGDTGSGYSTAITSASGLANALSDESSDNLIDIWA